MASDTTTKTWIACRDCGTAYLLASQPPGLLPNEELREAVAAFLDNHRGHLLTTLHATAESFMVSDRPLWDPLARVFIQATDGQTDYVITADRTSLDQERQYRAREGRLAPQIVEVSLLTEEAWAALCEAFGASVETTVLAQLLEAGRELAARIPPTALEPSFDDPDDPNVRYADWPEPYLSQLVQLGLQRLPAAQHMAWASFVRQRAVAHGALALRICSRPYNPAVHANAVAPL